MKTLLTTFLMVFFVSFAHAATKGRIMTDGKVSMYKNGKIINSFTNQGPVDENAIIACDGTCLVKIKGLSLIANDLTRFAIQEKDNSVSLFVETGKVNFAVSDLSKEFSFYHPGNNYVKSVGFITSASTASSAKGYMQVTDKGAKIAMEEGTIITLANDGTQTTGPGQAIMLAMVDVPPPDCTDDPLTLIDECCVDDPKTPEDECCVDDPKTQEDECDEAAAIILAGGGASSAAVTAGWVFAGAAALTAGIIIYNEINEDDNVVNVIRPVDPIVPPRPASPNR